MRRLFLAVALAALLVDQATKVWARGAAHGVEGRSLLSLWPGVFELKLVFNEGIAFGMFQGAGVFLTPIAAIIVFGAAWYSFRHPGEPRSVHVTMALLCAGALGNLVDRLAFGRVTDMFWIRAIEFPVFNVADACITFAGVLLALSVLTELFQHRPHHDQPATTDHSDQSNPTSQTDPTDLTDHPSPGSASSTLAADDRAGGGQEGAGTK